jgi:hypothetical protein
VSPAEDPRKTTTPVRSLTRRSEMLAGFMFSAAVKLGV